VDRAVFPIDITPEMVDCVKKMFTPDQMMAIVEQTVGLDYFKALDAQFKC
jgi:hypothetical protein